MDLDSRFMERFWAKVNVAGPHDCWEWTAGTDRAGYGRISLGGRGDRRLVGAHRASWQIVNGPIPDGLFVLHSCDNPPCVNPQHLRVGTNADNMADMVVRGRDPRKQRTHCPQGHEYTAQNTITSAAPSGRIKRSCRACAKARRRRDEQRRRERRIAVWGPEYHRSPW